MKLSAERDAGSPKIERVFPDLFSKSTPSIDRKSPLIFAASLLRYQSVEAAMILMGDERPLRIGGKVAFVGGYSVLTSLLRAKPASSYAAMFEPCERSFVAMPPLKSDQDLRELLMVFLEGRFGFTAATEGEMYSMVGLSDLLGLYHNGTLGSDLSVRDVASKPIAVGRQTSLREALKMMFERRVRRIFVEGTTAYISDREIVSRVFSPKKLHETKRAPGTMLQGSVVESGPVDAVEVRGDMPLKEAAGIVAKTQGSTLICGEGVVSPWDIVMKPFTTGHLNVR